MAANRLLIIDDETSVRELFAAAARRLGFKVEFARHNAAVLAGIRQFSPTAILLDLQTPDSDGIAILRLLADQRCDAKIIVVGGDEPRLLEAAARFGTARGLDMAASLQKPMALQTLQEALSGVLLSTWTVAELSTAIDKGELVVHYQPKVARCRNSRRWTIHGAEALLRWPHPVHGSIPPTEFILVAEDAHLMLPLTDFVLQRTLEQVRFWQSRDLALNIAVNVPPNLVGDEEFPERLCAYLANYGVENSRFTLEITESVAIEDPCLLVDVLARLRLRGVQIAIDDFGSGFASLKHLLYLPFNELKIDRAFVAQVDRSEEARHVVSASIDLAHRLGMTVCAEGVETPESLAFLEAHGCDRFQGYLVSKPLTSVDLEQFLRNWNEQGMQGKLPLDESAAAAGAATNDREADTSLDLISHRHPDGSDSSTARGAGRGTPMSSEFSTENC